MRLGARRSGQRRTGTTRAERRAEARRSRAHSHLQRVRGQGPATRSGRRLYAAVTAVAVLAGLAVGEALARRGEDAAPDAIFVHGAAHLSAAEIAAAARNASAEGTGPLDAVAARLADHAWIAEARALRLPSGDWLLGVRETEPVAVAAMGDDTGDWMVDARGVPFAPVEAGAAPGLLRVVAPPPLRPGEPSPALARAVAFAAGLPERGLGQPLEVAVGGEGEAAGFALRLSGLAPRVLLGDRELEARLATLAEILASDLPGLADAAELDLRFAGQAVLRNAPTQGGPAQAAVTRGGAAPST